MTGAGEQTAGYPLAPRWWPRHFLGPIAGATGSCYWLVAYSLQPHYDGAMRTATTIGFAVEEKDRSKLDHLAEVFGGGNRSAFLRVAIGVMEQLELVQELGRSQAYGAQRLADCRRTVDEIPEIVQRALADPDPEAVAQAKLVVADLSRRYAAPNASKSGPSSDDQALTAVARQAFEETEGL